MTSKKRKKKSSLKKSAKSSKSKNKWLNSEALALSLVGLIAFILYLIIFDTKIDLNGDNTSYYLLGKSLSNFEGYSYSFEFPKKPHGHFPPGYPMIIAPFMWISKSIAFIKVVNGLLYGVALWSIFKVLRVLTSVSIVESTIITTVIGMNFYFLKYSTIMMSEIPLAAVTGLAILTFLKMQKTRDSWKPSRKNIVLSALIAFAFLTKTLAIPLLFGILGYLIYKKSYKQATVTFLMFVLFILPYQIRNSIHNLGGGYIKPLTEINPYRPELGNMTPSTYVDRLVFNFDRYLSKEIPSGFFPIQEMGPTQEATLLHYALGIAAVLFMLVGMFRLKDYKFFIFLYIGASFGIFLLWPEVWFGVRFMFGVMPVMLILFCYGIIEIGKILSNRLSLKSNWIGIALLLIMGLSNTGLLDEKAVQKNTIKRLHAYSKQPYPKAFSNYFEVANWTKKNLPKDVVVSCRKGAIFALFSGGYTYRYPYTEDQNKFFEGLKNAQSKYLVVDQLGYSSTARFVIPRVNQNPEKFKLLYQTEEPKTYLLEVLE